MNLRKILTTAIATAALSTSAVAVAAAPANATTYASTGAAANIVGACTAGGIALNLSNNGMDYARTITYTYGYGWSGWSGWTQIGNGSVTVASGSSQAAGLYEAAYVQYAEWNGYSYEYGGEWVPFGNSYWCYH